MRVSLFIQMHCMYFLVHQIIYFYVNRPGLPDYYNQRDNCSWWCPFSYVCTSGKNWFQAESFFSPLCTGKLFLWKWTGPAGPLIPLCDSISFIKLWHLTCYKGIENSTIWAFQSAGFLLKKRGMYLKATFRSTCLSGLHFNKFLWKHTIYSPRWKKMNNGEFISQQILLETSKIQPRLTEREHHHIGVACENSPGLSFDTCNKEDQAAEARAQCCWVFFQHRGL